MKIRKSITGYKLQATASRFKASGLKLIFIGLQLLSCCLWLSACGYTTHSMIKDKFRTIHIKPFVNGIDITKEADAATRYKVYKPMLETDITRSVTNKFLFDGNVRLVSEELADLILKGELVEFRRDPLRYTDNDEVEEYRVNLIVDLILWDRKENRLLWEEKNFTGDATYFVSGPQAKSEDAAINDAISDLSRRIVERVVEQW
jgi:hypothetical protein